MLRVEAGTDPVMGLLVATLKRARRPAERTQFSAL